MSETYNSQLDAQNEMHELAKIGSEEYYDEGPQFTGFGLDTFDDPNVREDAMLAHWSALDEERGE